MKQVYLKILFAITMLTFGSGCMIYKTEFQIQTPSPSEYCNFDNYISVKKISLSGDMDRMENSSSLKTHFIAGFSDCNQNIKVISDESPYNDGQLTIHVESLKTNPTTDKIKLYVPYFGAWISAMQFRWFINYDWSIQIKYSFRKSNNDLLIQDAFTLNGTDGLEMENMVTAAATSLCLGLWPFAKNYPKPDREAVLLGKIATLAGKEISKRLCTPEIKAHFSNQIHLRDGMDIKTYAAFMEKKKRLKIKHANQREQVKNSLQGKISNSDLFHIEKGSVMVFGVGINQYDNFPDLKYAARDCKRIVSLLKSKYNLSDDRAVCLTDKDASAIKINRFLKKNAARLLTEDDTFIFYFGGHGAPDVDPASMDGDGLQKYLLLSNSESDVLNLTAIRLNNLFGLMKKLPCKRKIVLLDSCFAGTAGQDTLEQIKAIRISDKTYKNLSNITGSGCIILAASSENQVSLENSEIKAGIFTHSLIDGLNGKADANSNTKVDILELYNYVLNNVKQLSNGTQTPVFRGQMDSTIEF